VNLIQKGIPPFFEPGLELMLRKDITTGRLSIGTDSAEAMEGSECIFIAVQTPVKESGASDLSYLKRSAKSIGKALCKGQIVIVKSTVPPGTTLNEIVPILERSSKLKAGKDFGIAMNPEFLQEGKAVVDSLKPTRIVIGSTSKKHSEKVMRIFQKIKAPRVTTDIATAEMIKLVSNCFLATKISFANEIANLCEHTNTDVAEVMRGVGLDSRIGVSFLRAGLGFGGSCLPKDLASMIAINEKKNLPAHILRAVREVNDSQPIRAIELLEDMLGNLKGKRIALLGLAFKAGVDDVRDTRAYPIAVKLLSLGAHVVGYDLLAGKNFSRILPEVEISTSIQNALSGTDGCIIQTEEKAFSNLKKTDLAAMRRKIVVDGRRIVSIRQYHAYGVKYRSIGLSPDLT
jgi:UDPglucose 6-dehydrogenase